MLFGDETPADGCCESLQQCQCLCPGFDDDGDCVPNDSDACPNTPEGTAVDADGRPLGDIDRDCDTDLVDYGLFQEGFTGQLAR